MKTKKITTSPQAMTLFTFKKLGSFSSKAKTTTWPTDITTSSVPVPAGNRR